MSISVKNVSKLYDKQKALDDVSFEISKGEIVGFLGPNGAGKSTMMKIMTCFIPQTQGEVNVAGYDVIEQALEVKKNVGYLPEHNPLYLDMYVKEYLLFIAGLHKLSNKASRVDEMIEQVGLTVEKKKKIGALSKGYRQRVGLAQALIHEPQVLILDEPTTGLDPNQIVEIRNLIKEVGKEKTVMMSTHIMQEVEAICDRVIIINEGKIVANDSASNIRQETKNQFTVRVEFNKVVEASLIKTIADIDNCETIGNNVWLLSSHKGIDIRDNIFQFAVKNELSVLAMQMEEESIENVFKKLTAK